MYLGIDTSNYTTSVAIYKNGSILQEKELLPVKKGERGLRQSDAVFHHTQQLPTIIENIFNKYDDLANITSIGVSSTPRSVSGSYMPCFTVGTATARALAATMKIPLYKFSHQQGHILAALYGANSINLITQKFLAFHISGGTTEAVLVKPDKDNIISTNIVAETLDLNAGQLVDRVGVSLGLDFPCGNQLEKLAKKYSEKVKVKSTLKGFNCCLSGIENKCNKMLIDGEPKEKIAAYVLAYINQTLFDMSNLLLKEHGKMPIVFSGGVMSNSIIKESLTNKMNGLFSPPQFSADNAAGIAVLSYLKHNMRGV